MEHIPIYFNDDLRSVEVLEDNEKTLIHQNSAIGELLRLLVLHQHQQRDRKLDE
jgi:hypothetical protein